MNDLEDRVSYDDLTGGAPEDRPSMPTPAEPVQDDGRPSPEIGARAAATGPGHELSDRAAVDIDPANTPKQTDAPIDGVQCRSCGWVNPAGSQRCTRNAPKKCRLTLAGNSMSVTSHLYALNNTPEQIAFEEAGHALAIQSVADAGGKDELGARELTDHGNRATLQVQIWKLEHALKTQGIYDKRGRLRKGWLELLDRLIGSAMLIDKQLGLQRRAKKVDPLEAVRQAVIEANRTTQEHS